MTARDDRALAPPRGDELEALRRRAEAAEAEVARLRASEAALRDRAEQARALFLNAPIATFRARLDGGGLLDVNQRFCELVEAPRAELMARPLRSWWANPDDRAEMFRRLEQHGAFADLELVLDTGRARKTVIASATWYPEHGYLEGTLVDITARKQVEAMLRATEARLSLVFNATSDLLVLIDVADDRLTLVAMNEAYRTAVRTAFGIDAAAMLGRERTEALLALGAPPAMIEVERPALERAIASRTAQQYELEVPAAEGTLHLDVRVEPVLAADRSVTHLLYGARDATERKRAADKILASLREKETLLHEIHHRVKNNLQIVSSLLHLQAARRGDPQLAAALQDSRNRVAAIALVHQKLSQSACLAEIPFEAYIEDLAASLYRAYGESRARVGFEIAAGAHVLRIDEAVPCGLVVHEIVSNALRHAFPGDRAGTIRIGLGLDPDDHYQLAIEDDGVGLPADFATQARASLGVDLIGRLVGQIDGTVARTSSDRGTAYQIRFPRGR